MPINHFPLKPGEQFHADLTATPDPDMVEARVQDVLAVGGALHERPVDIFRGIDAFCEVFARRRPCSRSFGANA